MILSKLEKKLMLIDGVIDYFKLNTDYVFLFSKRDSLEFLKVYINLYIISACANI